MKRTISKQMLASRETVTDIYLITLLFAFPLFPGFSGYQAITRAKFIFLLVLTGLWLAALLVLALAELDPVPLPHLEAPQWAAIAFFAVCLLSSLLSPWRKESLLGAARYDGLLSTAIYVMIFLGASAFTRPKPIHAAALCVSAALCCALGVLQLTGLNPLGLYPGGVRWQDRGIYYSGAYLSPLGNTNVLDAMLCLVIPVCICRIFRGKDLRYAVPLVLSAAIALFAGGSGLWLALFVFVCAALLLLPRSRPARRRCTVVAAALCLGAVIAVFFSSAESGTVYELSQVLHGNLDDSFGSSRIRIWRECLVLVPEYPLLGGGPGTLALRLDVTFSRFVPQLGITLRSAADNAHNIYLGRLVNTGVLGLAAYLSLLLCSARCALRLARRNDLIASLFLGVFCGAVHACFGLGLCITEPLFFALLGLCCPLSSSRKETLPE